MELLIEAGGTKTDVFWMESNQLQSQRFSGLHPARVDAENERTIAQLAHRVAHADAVYYYGASMEVVTFAQHIRTCLMKYFNGSSIHMHSDLALVGHAAYGLQGTGAVGICGTGSNFGMMEQGVVHTPFPALGYLAGDEGGGVNLGKLVLQGWARGSFEPEVVEVLDQKFGSSAQFVSDLYGSAAPNAFLADVVKQVFTSKDLHPNLMVCVETNAAAFFSLARRASSNEKKMVLTGGIAYAFRDQYQRIGEQFNWEVRIEPDLSLAWFKYK